MTDSSYDKTFSATVGSKKIKYGVLRGNEKVVFIKVGADGSIRGYQDKYLRMAHRVHDRIGATVICASNPYVGENTHLKADRSLMETVMANVGVESCEMYFVGTSDGGYHALLLAQQFAQAVTYLGINSSHRGIEDFAARIQGLPQVRKILVYGRDDEDFGKDFPTMNALACDHLEVVALDGVDHDFTDRIDDFVALIDLI